MRIIRLFVLLALVASPIAAQTDMHWSMAGALGVVDPAYMASARVANGMSLALQSGHYSLIARYPVTNVYGSGSDKTPPWTTLQVTFTADDYDAYVTLYEVDRCTRTKRAICTVYPMYGWPLGETQCDTCSWEGSLDFASHIYYVEVFIYYSHGNSGTIDALSIY